MEEPGTPVQGEGEESLEAALSQLDQVSNETPMPQATEQVTSSQESLTTRESGEVDEIWIKSSRSFCQNWRGSEQTGPST